MRSILKQYVDKFNLLDNETYQQQIPNSEAETFLAENIPLLECPDKVLEETYYFRWWVYRKHIKQTPAGHIITEFLPPVPWAGPYNSINCPACFHIREGRWLKDSGGWLKEYIDFWLDEVGNTHFYSSWLIHAVWEYCSLKNDFAFAVARLPKLVRFFEKREKEHLRRCGLYWSSDNLDGMELSISGPGLRPTMNAYAYGDAIAIAEIADLAGDRQLQKRYAKKAEDIRRVCNDLLWDEDFYKVIPMGKNEDPELSERPIISEQHNARELLGYLPWYFSMPEPGKESAFSQLLDPDGFRAPIGPTTAEQRHPRFMEQQIHECWWNGPVWPFATSYLLVAIHNLLTRYEQNILCKEDYIHLLSQYAACHRITNEQGITVPWIDENLHPYTGIWHARQTLENWGWKPEKGGVERGKDYNHSLFCDLVLSGLLGIQTEHGQFTCKPLIPEDWNYFRVENLWLENQQYRITFDRNGDHYGNGAGLKIEIIDGGDTYVEI